MRIVAESLEAYIEGYVIDQWRNPRARKIAQSDDDRLRRIPEISAEIAELRRQKKDAFRMKLRREVDLQTFREVAKEMDRALDRLDRKHKSLTSEAAMPDLPDPSLAWEDLSAVDRRALTEMLVDKIVIERHRARSIRTAGVTTSSAPSHTKILSKRLSGSRRCTRLASRSSPESEQACRSQGPNASSMRSSSWVCPIAGARGIQRRFFVNLPALGQIPAMSWTFNQVCALLDLVGTPATRRLRTRS